MDDQVFRRLCAARRRLAQNDGATLREIAKSAGMSPRHFARVFKALFGQAPHAYRIRARMDHARESLASEARSVTRAALDQGYDSLPCFSDTFRRVIGETPSAFRKRARSGERDGALGPFPGCLCLHAFLP